MSPKLAQTMRGRRSKLLLLAAALFAGALCMQFGASPAIQGSLAAKARPSSGRAAASDSSLGVISKARTQPASWKDFGKQTSSLTDSSANGPFWQMLGMVAVIAVLGVVGLWMARRVLPRIQQRRGRNIAVLETACLGPHKSVHLLRVGQKEFLVASTRERISMLADVTGAADAEAAGSRLGEGRP